MSSAKAPSAAVYGRIGTHTTEFGTTASWLVEVLNVVTGNLDRPGGAMFPTSAASAPTKGRTPGGRGFGLGRWRSRVTGHPEVKGELPVAALAEEIQTPGEGQVRALITTGGNPVRSCPNSSRLDEALGSLEFMVSVDIYLNETTRPRGRRPALALTPGQAALRLRLLRAERAQRRQLQPAAAPGGRPDRARPGRARHHRQAGADRRGRRPEADPSILHSMLMSGLAERAGLDAAAEQAARTHLGPVEAMIDLMLCTGPYDGLDMAALERSPHGIDLGPLEPRLPELLRTVSGRIELASPALVDDVTRLAPGWTRHPDDELLLVGRRHLRSNNSWMHNIEVLVKGRHRCTLQLHPVDALERGVEHGDDVVVRSDAGEVTAVAKVTDTVSVGTGSLPHGWGHDVEGTRARVAARTVGVNSNVLTTDTAIDPLSGNARLNAIPVEVVRVPAEQALPVAGG